MSTTDPRMRRTGDPSGARFMAIVIAVAAILVVAAALAVLAAFL